MGLEYKSLQGLQASGSKGKIKPILSMTVMILIFLAGCASRERVYENLYEGLQQRERIVNPSDENVPGDHPSYKEYSREREDLMKDGGDRTEK